MSEGMVAEGVTAGTLLRQAREAAGLHVATLAANLKVPVRKLEALEEDRFDLLPDAVFIRALASSVCRTLKMDPRPVLERLPQTAQPRLVPEREGINAPFHSPSDGPSPGILDRVSRPVALTVFALLLGALVLVFLPLVQRGYDTVLQANMAKPVPSEGGPAGSTQVAAFPAGAVETTTPSPAGTAVAPNGSAAGVALSTTPALNVPAVASPAAPEAAAETPAVPIPANAVVVFRTRGPSWVQVTDARGSTVLQRLMGAGESAGAGGALPLAVTVGDVAQTEVQVRGKAFDLGSVARDNVARFEVK